MKTKGIIVLIIVLVFGGLLTSAYIVDETQQVVVTQFGRVIGKPKTEPGLYFRIPGIQALNYFPKNLQEWDGNPGQVPTLDKTYIWVDCFARWKIVDAVKYFQTVTNKINALARLDDYIDAAVRNFITSYRLIETVRNSNRELDTLEIGMEDVQKDQRAIYRVNTGREKIMQGILDQAGPKLISFGIELVDVKIKRINYVEQVRKSVYGRMIAERKQIAEKFRSEGQGEAQKIKGEKERMLKEIQSEAYKEAQKIKGLADAEATGIYAKAYGNDPNFYGFLKTMEIYEEAVSKDSSLILSTDSEFLKYLKNHEAD